MNITIDNRDFENVHIDTYAMLTGDGADDFMRDCAREDGVEDYNTVDIDYDMPKIVEALAYASIDIVSEAVKDGGIVKSITYKSHGSPKFYNFTTDYYVAEYDCDTVALHNYITKHYDGVLKKAQSYDDSIVHDNVSDDNLAHAGLCHYIDSTISADDYNMAMWEQEFDCYYNNMEIKHATL